MKKIGNAACIALACALCAPMAACGGNGGGYAKDGYSLSAEKADGGYSLRIEKDGVSYSTSNQALGVRFDKNEFRADDPVYAPYESLDETENGYIGKGSITSPFGTRIAFEDYYSVSGGEVNVDRRFTVAEAGEDYGFMTELRLTDECEGSIGGSDWMIPSTYYVTGEHTFADASTRMYYDGSNLVIPADDVSVLMAARYTDGVYVAMTDTTSGFRENVIGEQESKTTTMQINGAINIPGIELNDAIGKVSISHLYPTYVKRSEEMRQWRMLPVEEGLTRTVGFTVRIGKEKDYSSMLKTCWRNAYSRYGYGDKRYSADEVYETMISLIDRSYSDNNIWGSVPMYNTNADHYFPDSGFLYRNLEFATLMLKEGRNRGDKGMVDEAWTVIRDQIGKDRLDARLTAYTRENSVFKRVLFEGLEAAVKLYAYESENGDDEQFLSELLGYIVDKAEKYKDETSAMALTFYMALYRYQDLMFLDYTETVQRLLNSVYNATEDFKGYYGGVESTNTLISVAEDYMIIFRAFLDAYELDGNQKWLDKAIVLADYLETYQMIQPFRLDLIGTTGAEGYYFAFIGNERFLGYGYIFNNTQHGILDSANTSSVIDYYRLYKLTGDKHYLEFAENKLFDAFAYINMGDKVGYMDDPVHSSGKGFMNEFVGNSTTNTGFAEGGLRGAAHDSIIGWNIYQITSVFDWFKDTCGYILPEEMDASLVHDLAQNKYVVGTSRDLVHTAEKMVDGMPETYWLPSEEKTAVIDLNEYCNIKSVKVESTNAGAAVKISYSLDGKTFDEAKQVEFVDKIGRLSANTVARYVKIVSDTEIGISNISVDGTPVRYETIGYGAEIVSFSGEGNPALCLDESDYRTVWNAGASSETRELVLDLGSQCRIFQTALKLTSITDCAYRIEVSSDGETYYKYAEQIEGTPKFVFVSQAYAEARYVKLTLLSSQAANFEVCDFKVMGIKM